MADQRPQDVVKNQFATALEFHRKGRLKEAETLYRQIVRRVPDYFDALRFSWRFLPRSRHCWAHLKA
jgi:hypothetical protein